MSEASEGISLSSIVSSPQQEENNTLALSELSQRDKVWDKHRANSDVVEGYYTGSEFSNWVTEESTFEVDPNNQVKSLKLPSGNVFKLTQINGLDGKLYSVLEVSDWVALVVDVLDKPGKVRKPTQRNLIKFLSWFAVKGLYADAYTLLKGQYTEADNRTLSA